MGYDYKCLKCEHEFDEPIIYSGSYREYYGASNQKYYTETCPKCDSQDFRYQKRTHKFMYQNKKDQYETNE